MITIFKLNYLMKISSRKKYSILAISLLLGFSSFGTTPIYVSRQGSNSGDGSLKHPFLTLEKARDLIRKTRLSGTKERYSIQLRGGDYYFTETAEFNRQDKNLEITPYNNEKVRFTGGISIDQSEVKPVGGSDKEKLFPTANRGKIRMIDLHKLGITDYGELKQVGFGHPVVPSWMELFVNGKPFHLSRWPNDSTVAMGNILDTGSISAEGEKDNRVGKFTYSGDRPSSWKSKDDIWIFGYFRYGWADDAIKLAGIDTVGKIFTTSQPHLYGFFSKEKWNRWYAYNIPEEIDAPGEFYIDRKEGILYFYNPGQIEQLEVSVLEKPLISFKESADILVKGITFDCSRGVSVDMKSTFRCLLQNCTIRNMGSYAVSISDADDGSVGKGNGLIDCTISETGSGGIQLFGGNRQTLDSAGNFVENCSIHDFNRITKTYCAGVQIGGVGNRISHCEIYNSPHMAIFLHGNDHLIEYNDIHDVCQSTDDVGALYYGRNPSERGHQVRFNYFHQIGNMQPHTSAIYHDDGACGMSVFGNVFYKAGTWPVLIGGGCDNPYINNIFIDCPVGIYVDNRLDNWAKQWLVPGDLFEKDLNEISYNKPPYSIRYPELAKYWDENPAFPKRNVVDKNVFVRVTKTIKNDKKWLDFSENNLITINDPGFVNEKEQNFKLKESSEIFKKVPGFKQIPFEKIGILSTEKSHQ